MLWVVLGTAALVATFVVVGVMVDRRVPLLPPATTAVVGPGMPTAQPPPRLPEPTGDTAATAVKVPADWRPKLAPGKCACGAPLAIASDEAVRFDGRLLVVVRLACAACGHGRSVYLAPATA